MCVRVCVCTTLVFVRMHVCGYIALMCVCVSVDAEVYDEMHHETINIHYHTHKIHRHFGCFPLRGDWLQVSGKRRRGQDI